ncbi:Aste57867_10954 [Aphanomyces stellatus]|uniref:Carboxypeptidase n=1 Tax=Aphanomyces stellatus TaxID=120398 RepID=A0A485KRN0_9STRA|nr:hypothetical protein As57867_010914 [Aphanomyces stellatus]VFT87822.1 Aste57867_10954 [Aphanomyces stellatus]
MIVPPRQLGHHTSFIVAVPMHSTEETPLVDRPARRFWSKLFPVAFATVIAVTMCSLLACSAIFPSSATTATTIDLAVSFCDPTVKHEFGYIQLPHKVNDHYFYSYFESRNNPATDPLIVWLEGGPGASSTWSIFNLNGPCSINDDLSGTTPNPYSWTNNANVVWLDQPSGVGFSYGDATDDDHNQEDVGHNFYAFMQGFLQKHPELHTRPLFIMGESYGGHYVPAAAHYILAQQQATTKSSDGIRINLKGIAIGNGLTDTVTQMPATVHMARDNSYNISLVTPGEFLHMQADAERLRTKLVECQTSSPNAARACLEAVQLWFVNIIGPMVTNPLRNDMDLRQVCSPTLGCGDFGGKTTEAFLNQVHTRTLMGVHKQAHFQTNNDTTFNAFIVDMAKSYVRYVPTLLAAGVRVLLYVGDADLVCDWQGNDAWAKQLEWDGKSTYNAAAVTPLVVDGKTAGQVRSSHGLSFVRVFDAGHFVPRYHPEVAVALVDRFLHNAALDQGQ